MERRVFLKSCAALSGVSAVAAATHAWGDGAPKLYPRTRLVDVHGAPVKAHALSAETNYVFNFPYAATPCFLIDLGRPVTAPAQLTRSDGVRYAWQGGV